MMTYETFKEELLKEVTMELSTRGLAYDVDICTVNGTNVGYDAIQFSSNKAESSGNAGQTVTPLVRIEHFYTRCSTGFSTCKACAMEIVECFKEELDRVACMPKLDVSTLLDNVFPSLVSTASNAELLEGAVHRKWLDLSIIYRWNVSDCIPGAGGTIRVTPSLLEQIGCSEEQLHERAMENIRTKEDFACSATSMLDVMMDMMGIVSEEDKERFLSATPSPDDAPMYVLTRQDKAYGSYAMLDTNLLDELAAKLEDNLIILPSSIHEVIVIPRGDENLSSLATMVSDVNGSEVHEDERLSYSIYVYNRETKEVSIAS